ncbi:hypothetical protein V6N00_13475 [Tersicoccus sp. MR15.9]|uniref:hypothetical protein n=1 Tax=Tersicoccus mangrovi TaxID=3121635 RepID=UPI002FE67A5E
MTGTAADTLSAIAATAAQDGRGWDALCAQMACDATVFSDLLTERPDTIIDITAVHHLNLATATLHEAINAFRTGLFDALNARGLGTAFVARVPEITLPDLELDPATAGDFAAHTTGGLTVEAFTAHQQARGDQLAALSTRLQERGMEEDAANSRIGADRSAFTAHHAEDGLITGDQTLAALRVAHLMLTEALTRTGTHTEPAVRRGAARQAFVQSTFTAEPVHFAA